MPGTFSLRIVTPAAEVYAAEVVSVSLPGMEGSFGVLRNHAPLVSALVPGPVHVRDATGQEIPFCIGGGFFQVLHNQALLLADSAERADQIDVPRAQAAAQRAQELLQRELDPKDVLQREQAIAALDRARARLRVAGHL